MANNVQNVIEIRYNGDPVLREFFEKIGDIHKNDTSLSDLYKKSKDTREWWENNVGAKWAYIEDFELDESWCRIVLVSAWSPLDHFVKFIDEQTYHQCRITFQYIDEMPNFAGYYIIENGDQVKELDIPDMWELIDEEKEIRLKAESPVFTEDYEERDWKWDWMWDFVYDTIDPETSDV